MARILIVDDDDLMRSAIKEHLLGTYEVIDTGIPETALALALEHKPDAILIDLSMHGLSGFELCQALSSLRFTRHIPVFVCGADERNKAFCENLGAFRFFKKPVDFAKLKTDLASVVSLNRDERRGGVRVQLRVILRLTGKTQEGMFLEARATTENMSAGGFLCSCTSSLEKVTTVEVCLCGEREHRLGRARLVRVLKTDTLDPRYGFQFIGSLGAGEKET